MKNIIILCLFALLTFVLCGCNKTEQTLGALPKAASSPAAKTEPSQAAEKPFEYKEPDHAFFKVANHKKECLPEERAEELFTLPNDKAVVRYVTYTEQEIKDKESRDRIQTNKAKGIKYVYLKTVLLDKKTKKETVIDVSACQETTKIPIIIDAMIDDEMTEIWYIDVLNGVQAELRHLNLKNPERNCSGSFVFPAPREFTEYTEIYFVTPSLIHVKAEVPESERKDDKRKERIDGIEYYVKIKSRITYDEWLKKDIDTFSGTHVWYNEKYYRFFAGSTLSYGVFNIPDEVRDMDYDYTDKTFKKKPYKEMPLPKYDVSEWKGWTRMNFDRKNLIK